MSHEKRDACPVCKTKGQVTGILKPQPVWDKSNGLDLQLWACVTEGCQFTEWRQTRQDDGEGAE